MNIKRASFFMTLNLKELDQHYRNELLDTKEQKRREQRQKRREEKAQNDLRELLTQPKFRRVVHWLLDECEAFADGYVHGDSGYGTTFNAGRKSVGNKLIAMISKSKPEALWQMILEHHAEEQRNAKDE